MDFSKILDEWDKQAAKRPRAKESDQAAPIDKVQPEPEAVNPMVAWMRRYGVEDKDSVDGVEGDDARSGERRRRLRSKRPDAVIDLHGLTRDEAWLRLDGFFRSARDQGLEKLLVIHGKGNNSAGDAVLGAMTRQFIEQCPWAGESGHPESREGGKGSTWVLLKQARPAAQA